MSAFYGINWKVRQLTDLVDLASHPSAILSDGRIAVFAKLSLAANGLDQFEIEKAGLETLNHKSGVQIPVFIDLMETENGALMVQQAEIPVERGEVQWREIGSTLARIHLVGGNSFGYNRQGYFGPLYQDNRPMDTWLDFYLERRLRPKLVWAIESGNMPSKVIWQVEHLIERLPGLDIPEVTPCLLHGDAQQNNFISTAKGAVVIDPAVYYGHPEMDLAYVDYFQPMTDDVYKGYQELRPIEKDFLKRRDLWLIPSYLTSVSREGPGHLPALVNALRLYL